MRIIGGELKGRILPKNKKLIARPTTDKAKEALFNILNFELDYSSISVLDLFSGTGSISLEFFSRGVRDITAIDIRYEHIKYIKNISQSFSADISILKTDAFKFIERSVKKYDLIFIDPPYDHPRFDEILPLIRQSKIIKDNTILIIEHGSEQDYSQEPELYSHKKYSKVNFSFFLLKEYKKLP